MHFALPYSREPIRAREWNVTVWMRNIPHRLHYLDTWPPVGHVVWGIYGTFKRCSLVKGSMSLEMALTVDSLGPLPIHSLCFLFVVEGVLSVFCSCGQACCFWPCLLTMMDSHTSATISQNRLSSISHFLSWHFVTATEQQLIPLLNIRNAFYFLAIFHFSAALEEATPSLCSLGFHGNEFSWVFSLPTSPMLFIFFFPHLKSSCLCTLSMRGEEKWHSSLTTLFKGIGAHQCFFCS